MYLHLQTMDMYIILNLLFASGFNFIRAETSQGLAVPCPTKLESVVKFSVTGLQNSTGHLIYEISLDRETNAGHKPWLVEVEDDTTVCDGVEFSRTTSTITYAALAPALASAPAPTRDPCPAPAPCQCQCPSQVPTPAPHQASTAAPEYEYYIGFGHYKFHRNPEKTWPEAKRICEEEGAHLAIINSEDESALLVRISAEERHVNSTWEHGIWLIWVGFHDRNQAGHYVTVFDTPVRDTGFTRWHTYYTPDDWGDGRSCGSMATLTGGLIDFQCRKKERFICEK